MSSNLIDPNLMTLPALVAALIQKPGFTRELSRRLAVVADSDDAADALVRQTMIAIALDSVGKDTALISPRAMPE